MAGCGGCCERQPENIEAVASSTGKFRISDTIFDDFASRLPRSHNTKIGICAIAARDGTRATASSVYCSSGVGALRQEPRSTLLASMKDDAKSFQGNEQKVMGLN